MTLMETAPIHDQELHNASRPDYSSDEDNQFETVDDDVKQIQPFGYQDALVQCLGYPGDDLVPTIGKVSIENSSDVHFGDKNIYQGPVTIKQVVYANGHASLVAKSDKAKDNLSFEPDGEGEEFKASESKDGAGDERVPVGPEDNEDVGWGFRKGFIWLQNVSEHRSRQILIVLGVAVLFITMLLVVLLLRRAPAGKLLTLDPSKDYESEIVRPIGYDPDITNASLIKNTLRIVSRQEWLAQPPTEETDPLPVPVPYVIIHHTATENCTSQSQCVFYVRQIQTYHIESRGWYDIGYNFLVGGDGAAYEGRGWTTEGAHALGWNNRSLGIAFIGTFNTYSPSDIQILACKRLIKRGLELGYIREDYKLLAVRQLQATESPGLALFEKIRTWEHWVEEP